MESPARPPSSLGDQPWLVGTGAGAASELPVGALMSEGLITSPISESLAVAAARMSANRIHAVLVESEGDAFGVLTDADLLAALGAGQDPEEVTVGSLAATEPLTITADAKAGEAARLMHEHGISHLFVVDPAERPVGVVSSLDLAHAVMRARSNGVDAQRLLVAHDGRAAGDDAVALARLLATDDAEVIAAIVVPFPPGEVGDPPLPRPQRVDSWPELCRGLRAAGSRLISERALQPLAHLRVSERVLLGDSAPGGLSSLCERESPDMVVIGSTHRGKVGRVLLGSTGERLAHGSSVPVAIAPPGFAEQAPASLETIAVGFDGRPESMRALRLAARLARRHGALLKLVAVLEPQIGELEIAAQAFDALRGIELTDHRADRMEERARAALATEEGVSATIEIVHGPASTRLIESCREAVDLLVVGSRGYGPLARVLFGSVSTAVSRSAPCPLVVAPRNP